MDSLRPFGAAPSMALEASSPDDTEPLHERSPLKGSRRGRIVRAQRALIPKWGCGASAVGGVRERKRDPVQKARTSSAFLIAPPDARGRHPPTIPRNRARASRRCAPSPKEPSPKEPCPVPKGTAPALRGDVLRPQRKRPCPRLNSETRQYVARNGKNSAPNFSRRFESEENE
jgi:hypothetical protein